MHFFVFDADNIVDPQFVREMKQDVRYRRVFRTDQLPQFAELLRELDLRRLCTVVPA